MLKIALCVEMPFLFFFFASVSFADTKEELLARGHGLLEKNDYAGAAKAFAQVIEVDPTCADGYYGRGRCYAALGNYDLAIGAFSLAIHNNPQYGHAYCNRGVCYLGKGN